MQDEFAVAKFSRSALQDVLADLETPTKVELLVSGQLTDGVDFTFPADANIPPFGRLLVVKDPPAFTAAYGSVPVRVLGPYDGWLDNGGERLQLDKPGDTDAGVQQYIRIDRVNYDDQAPWPTEPDGAGSSLTRINPDLYGNDPINWDSNTPSPGTTP